MSQHDVGPWPERVILRRSTRGAADDIRSYSLLPVGRDMPPEPPEREAEIYVPADHPQDPEPSSPEKCPGWHVPCDPPLGHGGNCSGTSPEPSSAQGEKRCGGSGKFEEFTEPEDQDTPCVDVYECPGCIDCEDQPATDPVPGRPETGWACKGSGQFSYPHLIQLSGPAVGGPFPCPGCPDCQGEKGAQDDCQHDY